MSERVAEIKGVQVLNIARAANAEIPIILITGDPSLDSAVAAVSRGAATGIVSQSKRAFTPVQLCPSTDATPDGTVHVMWGDMRDDPAQIRYHVYYTRSDDQGETFGFTNEELGLSVADTRVTDFASNANFAFPGGRFIGDYFSLTATEDDVHMAWPDARLGEVARDQLAVKVGEVIELGRLLAERLHHAHG